MARDSAAFADLVTRAGTGLALAAVALVAVWAGGWVFLLLVSVAVGVLAWEAARLTGLADRAVVLAVLAGLAFPAAIALPVALAESLLLLPGLVALMMPRGPGHPTGRTAGALFLLAILLAGYVAVILREGGGVVWMLWLILVVVTTDICGYFAGRLIGGPKFWPRVSPKKTWAGVVAGWVGAGIVGALFMAPTGTREGLIVVSIFLSGASQLGDIAESAVKRRAGVKDSSNLLPGHGGLLDRLDGVLGACLILGLVAALTNYPEAPI